MRRTSPLVALVLAVGAPLVLGGCGGSHDTPTISDAAAVVRALPAAATRAGAVRFVEATRTAKVTSTLTGELSASDTGDAQERLVQGKALLVVERVSGVIYLRASAAVLESTLELSLKQATPYAGRWVSLTPGDLLYPSVSSTLDLGAELRAFLPNVSGLKAGSITRVEHHTAVPLTGAPPAATAAGSKGVLTLFVPPQAPHLPLGATMVLREGAQRETRVVAFTRWGVAVHLTAPAGAVTYRSIATSS